MPEPRVVVVDTDVFSRLFLRQRAQSSDAAKWRASLAGSTVVIAVQTRAEILAGAFISNWGERRLHETRQQLDRTATVPVDSEVVEAFARLTAACRREGHALQDKQHVADRWIAASAIAHDVPLLSGDGVFRWAPQLQLLGEADS
jgi:predicted nucleic acid-binding protein